MRLKFLWLLPQQTETVGANPCIRPPKLREHTWKLPYTIHQFKIVGVLCFGLLLITVFGLNSFAQDDLEYTLLTTLGRGTAEALAWRSDGAVLAIGGSAGVWFFDRDYNQIAHLETFPVSMVAWRPNGAKIPDQIAAALEDGGVELWDVNRRADTFSLARTFADNAPSGGIAWCKDGVRLATEAADGNAALIWNARTGEQLMRVETLVGTPVWSPDCTYIAGRRPDYVIGLWNVETGIMERFFGSAEEKLIFNGISFNPDGRLVTAVTGLPANLYVWHVNSGTLITVPEAPDKSDYFWLNMRWSVDGRWVAVIEWHISGSFGGTLIVISTDSWAVTHQLTIGDHLPDATWTPDSTQLTALHVHGVTAWTVETDVIKEHQIFSDDVRALSWRPNSIQLATLTGVVSTIAVDIWQIEAYPIPQYDSNVHFSPYSVDALAWTPDGVAIVTFSYSTPTAAYYNASLWEASTGANMGLLLEKFDQFAPGIIVGWDRGFTRYAMHWYHNGIVEVYNGQRQKQGELKTSFSEIASIIWSLDDRYIAVVSQDFRSDVAAVEIFDSTTFERVREFKTFGLRWFFGWAVDSARFLLSTYDPGAPLGSLYALEVENEYPYFYEVAAPVESAAYSTDITTLAFTYGAPEKGYTVQALDSISAAPLAQITTQQRPVLRWHPHQNILATAADDTLVLWNPRTDTTLARILISGVNRIAWSPDGTKLAAVGHDQRIRVFKFDGLALHNQHSEN